MINTNNRTSCDEGQWVKFSTNNTVQPHESWIYGKDCYFFVMSRFDLPRDECRCYVVGTDEQVYDYCPRIPALNTTLLKEDYKLTIIPEDQLDPKMVARIKQVAERERPTRRTPPPPGCTIQ